MADSKVRFCYVYNWESLQEALNIKSGCEDVMSYLENIGTSFLETYSKITNLLSMISKEIVCSLQHRKPYVTTIDHDTALKH